MADALDLTSLDRDVARTAQLAAKAEARVAEKAAAHGSGGGDGTGAEVTSPYAERRQVAGRSTFMALAPQPGSVSFDAPLREGLRRWVYAFTLQRIAWEKTGELADALHERVAIVERPVSRKVSWREAWRQALEATVVGDVEMYTGAASDAAPTVASAAREVEAVLREAAHRLQVDDRALFETGVPSPTLVAFTRTFVDATDAIAAHALAAEKKRREGTRDSVADFFALALGRSAGEGWPAKLSRRWLEELAPPLVRGLSLDVGPLPEALGAASFARALLAFGRAMRVAGPSPSLPFSLARDPFPVDAERFGLAFASLVTSAPFHRRVLGTGADVAQTQARVGEGMALATARLAAVRWLSRVSDDDEREELGQRLFGVAPAKARELFSAFPVPRRDDAVSLLALATTSPFVTELVDRHDDDWFHNPRALADLRARASAPAHAPTPAWAGEDGEAEAIRAARELARHFEHALA
jgi:hypothetical protein